MGDFFGSLRGGVARFALAWVLPTSAAVGLFWAFCIPALADMDLLPAVTGKSQPGSEPRDALVALGIATFISFVVAVILAYSSQFIYRVLEGYHLPRPASEALKRHQRRRYLRLTATKARLESVQHGQESSQYGLAVEQLGLYPSGVDRIMPTRLGNALRAMERYGSDTFHMDSQQFWYELIGSVDTAVRTETEEARAMVDVFIAAVAVSTLLAASSGWVALTVDDKTAPLALMLGAAAFAPVAYRGAIRNMKEWHNSVRALVNLGRVPVALGLGMIMPKSLEGERTMWDATSGVFYHGMSEWRPYLNVFRRELHPGNAREICDDEERRISEDLS